MGFLKLCWYNSIKNSGLVAPVSQSEIDEKLADSHKTQCIMGHIYDGNDGIGWVILIEREIMSHSLALSEIFRIWIFY